MSETTAATPTIDRRRNDRLRLPPMYTRVLAGTAEGHAYDISASGVRIELDETPRIGEEIALRMDLPGATGDIATNAKVVWVGDVSDDPGPRRLALRFTVFRSMLDRHRLAECLGRYRGIDHAMAA